MDKHRFTSKHIEICDSHCHLQMEDGDEFVTPIEKLIKTMSNAISKQKNVTKVCLIGTREIEWKIIEELYSIHPHKIVPSYGIHPWRAHRYCCSQSDTRGAEQQFEELEQWQQSLRTMLQSNPMAIIGETGIDKAAKAPETGKNEYDIQSDVFRYHFELAAELNRPIVIHCVRSAGKLFDFFQEYDPLKKRTNKSKPEQKTEDGIVIEKPLPPSIVLHSYSGGPEMVSAFLNLRRIGNRLFFSFSQVINSQSPKTNDAIAMIPEDKIMIESDQISFAVAEEDVRDMVSQIAEIKRWTLQQTAEVTYRNASRFFEARNKS